MTTEIKVGDLVTAYARGFWRVTEIIPRKVDSDLIRCGHKGNIGDDYPPLVNLESVLSESFKKAPKRKSQCDVTWCAKVSLKMEKTKALFEHEQRLAAIDQLKTLFPDQG